MPPVPAPGVPLSVAVPLPLSMKLTPKGNAPLRVSEIGAVPVVVTRKLPATPTLKVVAFALVMVGAFP